MGYDDTILTIKKLKIMKFKLKTFIYAVLGAHLVAYMLWSFVELSLTIPLITVFESSRSRAIYLGFLFSISMMITPHFIHDENDFPHH